MKTPSFSFFLINIFLFSQDFIKSLNYLFIFFLIGWIKFRVLILLSEMIQSHPTPVVN